MWFGRAKRQIQQLDDAISAHREVLKAHGHQLSENTEVLKSLAVAMGKMAERMEAFPATTPNGVKS